MNLKCQLVQSSDAQARRGRPDDDVELGSFRSVRPPPARPVGGESFAASMYERGSWLTGLLIFQSFSSFILVANEGLLASHPDIIFFLTMLVGAGGNAGNQAAVRVIRGLAVGSITPRGRWRFLRSELGMALALSCFVGLVGCARAVLSFRTSPLETLAITVALVTIIFISVVTGSVLPFVLQYFKFDPAHSSTSIQVPYRVATLPLPCPYHSRSCLTNDLCYPVAGDHGHPRCAHHMRCRHLHPGHPRPDRGHGGGRVWVWCLSRGTAPTALQRHVLGHVVDIGVQCDRCRMIRKQTTPYTCRLSTYMICTVVAGSLSLLPLRFVK